MNQRCVEDGGDNEGGYMERQVCRTVLYALTDADTKRVRSSRTIRMDGRSKSTVRVTAWADLKLNESDSPVRCVGVRGSVNVVEVVAVTVNSQRLA